MSLVTCNFCLNLRDPIIGVMALRQLCAAQNPAAAVPKVSVTKNCDLLLRENQVRSARKPRDIYSEPIAISLETPSENQLWSSVLCGILPFGVGSYGWGWFKADE